MDKRPAENEIYPLAITGYAGDGAGVARLDGMVVFVQRGIRGEVCEVKLTKVGRSAIWGRAVRPISPSPARQTPDCPLYGRCGGCAYRHMTYTEELEAKRAKVEDALRRIGGTELAVPVILGAPQPERYRNKVQFPVSAGPRIGFYQAQAPIGSSTPRTACCSPSPPPACAPQRRTGCAVITSAPMTSAPARAWCAMYMSVPTGGPVPVLPAGQRQAVPHEADLVCALRAAEPGLAGVVLGINEKKNNVILGDAYRTLWGRTR